jgi:hypothetical protein
LSSTFARTRWIDWRLVLLKFAAFAIGFSIHPNSAWAGAGVLVFMRKTGIVDTSPYELRLRSELQTEGIDAVVVNANSSMSEPKTMANRLGTNGIIEAAFVGEEANVSVWVNDPSLLLEITRSTKVSLTQKDSVMVFALRSVDLLLGAKLELEQQRRARAPGTTDAAATSTEPPSANEAKAASFTATDKNKEVSPTPKNDGNRSNPVIRQSSASERKDLPLRRMPALRERVRVGAAISLMRFTDELKLRIAPSVSVTYSLSRHWATGLTFSGPYVATIFANVGGQSGLIETNPVTIDQEFLWFDVRYRWSMNEQFDLEPNLGLGGARYGVSGEGGETYVGRSGAKLSLFSSFGGSLVWRVSPRVRLVTEVATLIRWQTPKVLVDGRDETGTSSLDVWGAFGPAWVF